MKYLTTKEAAAVLGVSTRHIQRLVAEADGDRHSRWRFAERSLILLHGDQSSERCGSTCSTARSPGNRYRINKALYVLLCSVGEWPINLAAV